MYIPPPPRWLRWTVMAAWFLVIAHYAGYI
jgi:hypothetical protein